MVYKMWMSGLSVDDTVVPTENHRPGTSTLNNSMSLVKSSLENQPYYNLESIFRAFKRKEMKASRRLAENDIITRGVT